MAQRFVSLILVIFYSFPVQISSPLSVCYPDTEFTHFLSNVIVTRKRINCILMDFCKAFYTLPPFLLLEKFVSLGNDGKVTKYIAEPLSGREHSVVLNGQKFVPVLVPF